VAKKVEKTALVTNAGSRLADRLNAALEGSRKTVTDLNEAMIGKSGKVHPAAPIGGVPERGYPDEGKSA
jgi:hypothetical protein